MTTTHALPPMAGSDDLSLLWQAHAMERWPLAHAAAAVAWKKHGRALHSADVDTRVADAQKLARLLTDAMASHVGLDNAGVGRETQPFLTPSQRAAQASSSLYVEVEGFLVRAAFAQTISKDEQQQLLRGIILTRAVDNRMKQLFLSSEMKYGELGFQGKGFRSLGQEAIFGAALRLRHGPAHVVDGAWHGDIVGPLIRDLGVSLAFTDDVTMCLNAQVGKAGPPAGGKDLHLGSPQQGVLMAAAPLTIATCTALGYALAFRLRHEDRVAVSFIGEGGSSLGEWHEAITTAAAMKLPMVFCVQNNQTALSTPVHEQSPVRTFADKAVGYGIPSVSVDGTDVEAVAAAFAWAAWRARAGQGPTLIETIAMRMCGHAHHDDMLYLGVDPPLGFSIPDAPDKGYVDKQKYAAWRTRDPLQRYAMELQQRGVIKPSDVQRWQEEANARVEASVQELHTRPWPAATDAGSGVMKDVQVQPSASVAMPALPAGHARVVVAVEDAPPFSPKGTTYLDAICQGVGDVLNAVPSSFVIGEDVGPPYGNAFLLLKPLLEQHGARMFNAPIAEGGILGACIGAALAGMRPIGEMQFNDFVASGFNQLVNNAAKLRYRSGQAVPMTVRMPWGGLRRAGPYHSQDTSPWFYRCHGLKIVAPSTPHDARALLMTAVLDDDPVLFYEHIGLYRDPKIKQLLPAEKTSMKIGEAAFRRVGTDLTLISYGAYVHKACSVADQLQRDDGVSCDVLDLRTLWPLDWARIEATVRRTGKVMLVGEDSRTGSILESIASRIHESLFDVLDGPVRVLGSLDTPVPYSPSLEDAYLLQEPHILQTARALLSW
jgi:2-oxoisovalerate dehydrogenase E1 component